MKNLPSNIDPAQFAAFLSCLKSETATHPMDVLNYAFFGARANADEKEALFTFLDGKTIDTEGSCLDRMLIKVTREGVTVKVVELDDIDLIEAPTEIY